MNLVKMYSNGITISVSETDVDFYKRAGYVVVVEKPDEKPAEKPAKAKKEDAEAK